ncbi:MAG: DUF1302 family protein [Stagnimonas sp.]|nr:DUF1302 family protein [Stagnimonas sp.]
MRNPVLGRVPGLLLGVLLSATAAADGLDFSGLQADYKLTLNYGVGIRMESPDPNLINGPLDPFELHLDQVQQGSGFTHTGYSTTINQDDGNRNFAKHALTNNRLSALAEVQLRWGDYGAIVSADGFYDWVYHQRNDNNSPRTVNKRVNDTNQFSPAARHYDGERARLLDTYVYGTWLIRDDMQLDLRLGNQMVAWGESLFLPGVSGAQSTADATKAFTPGVEVKQILLPTQQLSASLSVGNEWTLMGYYKFDFQPNQIFPVGDYFSPTDSVGPGAEFSYGAVNPLYLDGCPGLLGPLSNLCQLGGVGGTLFNAPPDILIPYVGAKKASKYGQYGLALRYQATPQTTLGLYALRYHDPNPSVGFNSGYPVVATFPVEITTQVFNEPTASSYYLDYFAGVRMFSASYSTVLGPFNVAGEASYKQRASVPVQALQLGTVNPLFARGELMQLQSSLIYATNPRLYFDDVAFAGEVAYLRVLDVEAGKAQPGIVLVGDGRELFYNRNAWGFQFLVMPTKRNLLSGWDLTLPTNFGWLPKGNPSSPGVFGALYGEGDMRLSVGASFQRLQNLQIGVTYNMYFGDTEQNIGASFLRQNPYADRDNISLNIKYSL